MNVCPQPSSIAPLQTAWNRTAERLFRPFRLTTWVGLGFTAWLARVGEGGFPWSADQGPGETAELGSLIHHGWTNYPLLVLVFGGILAGFLLTLLLLTCWVRCRGAFIFLENAVQAASPVVVSWRRWQGQGNALFRWVLGYALGAFLVLLLLLSPLFTAGHYAAMGRPVPWLLVAALTAPLLLAWVLGVSIIQVVLDDFIVPLMTGQPVTVWKAWQAFGQLVRSHLGSFLAYLGVRISLAVTLLIVVFVGGCLTCCCLFALLMVPILWAVALLPWLLFMRLYSVVFLQQFGVDVDHATARQPPRIPPALPQVPAASDSSGP